MAEPRLYRLMDLFAGCGGMTRGFVDTGRFEPILAVEMDADAAATYAANFGYAHMVVDKIEHVDEFPKTDVLIGGPPCQGFSLLNSKGVGLERRALWREYLRALRESDAEAFVMENVPQLLSSAEYDAFKTAAEQELGFTVEGRILNAADYGVPQRRRRAIVIGVRHGEIPWPIPTHHDPAATRRSRWVDLPDDLFAVVVDRLPAREDRGPDAPLFPIGSADRLRMAIGRACRDAGVPVFSRHDLRHRRISLLHHQGLSWAEIGARVGQRNLSTTADIYTHVLMDYREIDRSKLLERVRVVHPSVHTPQAENRSFAGPF